MLTLVPSANRSTSGSLAPTTGVPPLAHPESRLGMDGGGRGPDDDQDLRIRYVEGNRTQAALGTSWRGRCEEGRARPEDETRLF